MIFLESHTGWKAKQGLAGLYEIVDQNGWALATIHYDYRYTCNATNESRGSLLSAAPEMLKALVGLQVIAEQNVTDLCAAAQEGGPCEKMELARWSAVGEAIAKATGTNGELAKTEG